MLEVLKSSWQVISRVKTNDQQRNSVHFRKCITPVDLTAFGLASVVGTGIHAILSHAASEHAGPSVVLSVLVASVATVLSALCYAELVELFPESGGSCYKFVYATVGEIWAFLVGWNMVLELIIGSAVAAKAFIEYSDTMINGTLKVFFRSKMKDLGSTQSEFDVDIGASLLMLFVTGLTSFYVKMLCVVNNVLVVFGLLVVGSTIIVGFLNMDSENWTKGAGFFPKGLSGILSAASPIAFAFVGFDMMTAMAKEMSCCHSRVLSNANAYVFSVGLLLLFTASVALTSMVPYESLRSSTSMVDVFNGRGIDGMRTFAAVGAISCLFASVIAAHFTVARILQEMANDGLLFSPLARVGPLRGTPWISAVGTGIIASVLAAMFDITVLVKVLGMGTLLNSAAAPIAVLVLHYSVNSCLLPMNINDSWGYSHNVSEDKNDKGDSWDDGSAEMVFCSRTESLASKTSKEICESPEVLRCKGNTSGSPRISDMKFESQACATPLLKPIASLCQTSTENVSLADYGTIQRRDTSIELGDEGFHTMLLETSFEAPTMKSWKIFWITLLIMIILVLLFGTYSLYFWELSSFYWHRIVICLSIFCILAVMWMLLQQQRRHFHNLQNSVPCMPFLPLVSLSLHLILMICLPSVAWLRLSVWSFMGIIIYSLYGARHSTLASWKTQTNPMSRSWKNIAL